jgi:hypothetical protein
MGMLTPKEWQQTVCQEQCVDQYSGRAALVAGSCLQAGRHDTREWQIDRVAEPDCPPFEGNQRVAYL